MTASALATYMTLGQSIEFRASIPLSVKMG